MDIRSDENLQFYVEESLEHLADIENDLLAIEQAGANIDEEIVNKVFRAAHSIKGGAAFMGLTGIKELSNRMENLLNMIRSREMVPTPEIVNVLLLACDALRNLLSDVGSSSTADIAKPLEALEAITAGALTPEEKEIVQKRIDISFPDGRAIFNVEAYDIHRLRNEGKYIYLVEFDLIHDVHKKGKTPLGQLNEMIRGGVIIDCKVDVVSAGTLEDEAVSNKLPFLVLYGSVLEPDMISVLVEVSEENIFELSQDMTVQAVGRSPEDETPAFEETAENETVSAGETPPREKALPVESIAAPARFEASGKDKDATRTGSIETSLRVNVRLLDALMNLAGELVMGRNQLLKAIASRDVRATDAAGQRLDLITNELQEAIMLTRMQPIGSVFNKFSRVVRDLARNLGKHVELILEGKDVALDKAIIEAISDPLTHLVRNSVDHGIELPEERRSQGKALAGRVVLRACHEAGQVNIEIIDDGKGIDGNRVADTAIHKGLLSKDRARLMSDKEKVGLIFLPGLSTAQTVTDVSGRGVGMDVVKTNLDTLGGVVEIDSDIGKGTTIRIKLPLTLAVMPSQIVSIGKERFAIPQVNIDELLRIPASQVKERIERVGHAAVVRLRGQLLPLLSLPDVLGISKTYWDPGDGAEKPERRKGILDRRSRKSPAFEADAYPAENPVVDQDRRSGTDRRFHSESSVNIVVVSAGVLKYGLVVDRLHDPEEIVVKALGRHLMHCKGYAGATILGDGRVALVLDVVELSRMAELTSVEGSDRAAEVAEAARKTQEDTRSLLIFRNAEDEQFALPLERVQRIEKIRETDIESVGGKRVIRYRGGSLPLFAIEEVAQVRSIAHKEALIVFVLRVADREAGLLATGPVDAVEVPAVFDEITVKQPGITGSTIIHEQTTLLVDIDDVVKTLYPQWFTERGAAVTADSGGHTILYAEDSNFFRDQIKGFMESEGYTVIAAENGQVAWDLLQEHGDRISIVVTDLKMPEMDGYGLAENIKNDARFAHLPVIALTTLAGEEDMARGRSVGMSDYQIKLDREKLMSSINNHLKAA